MNSSNRLAQCAAENLELKQSGAVSSSDGPRTSCGRKDNFSTFNGTNPERAPGSVRAERKQEIHQVDRGGQISTIAPLGNGNSNSDRVEPIHGDNLKRAAGDARPKEPFRFAGYLSTILASLFYSAGFLFVKLMPVEDNLPEKAKAIMIRGILTTFLCGLSIVHQGHKFKLERGEYWLNFWRSTLSTCTLTSTYASLMYITLGENLTIINWSCVWTCLLGFIILREPLPLSMILALPISLLGVVLLVLPQLILGSNSELDLPLGRENSESSGELHQMSASSNQTLNAAMLEGDSQLDRWPGFALSIAGSIMTSIVTIILKFRRKTPIVTCSFYFALSQALFGLLLQLVVGFGALPNTALEWALHAATGLVSFGFQNTFQWGIKLVPAGTYSVIRTLDIPFSFLLGAIFLNELILWTSVAGSTLIMLVVILLVFNDNLVQALKSLCS